MRSVSQMTSQIFSKLAFAASAFLTESGAHATFQDSTNEPQTAAATAADETLSIAPEEGAHKASIIAAVERLERDIVNYDQLPPEIRNDSRVIKAGLFNPRTASQVLAALTPEQVEDQQIALHIVLSSRLWVTQNLNHPLVFSSSAVAQQLEKVLVVDIEKNAEEALLSADLFSALSPSLRSDVMIGAMLIAVEQRVNKMLDRSSTADLSTDPPQHAPPGLITLRFAQRQLDARFLALDRPTQMSIIRFFNLETAASHTLIEGLQLAPEEALKLLKPEEISTALGGNIADYIAAHPRESAELIKDRLELLNNPVIMQAAFELIAHDITIISRLPRSGGCVNRCAEAVRQFLSREGVAARIAGEIRHDINSLNNYPSLVMQAPEIQHATRDSINRILWYKKHYFSMAVSHTQLRTLVGRFVHEIPDIAGLITTRAEYESCAHLIPDVLQVNPGAHIYLGKINPRLDIRANIASLPVLEGLHLLGIEGIGRFDNAVELVINRYHSASPDLRAKLKSLLEGNELFRSRIHGLESDPSHDPRPVCIVISATPITDYNGAFDCRKRDGSSDDIDALTSFYRVVYYEVGDAKAAFRAITETYNVLGKKTQLLIVQGHGDEDGIALSPDTFPDPALTHTDVENLSLLQEAFGPHSKISLQSCSAAKSFDGQASLAEEFHRALPFTTIYGPSTEASSELTLLPTGELDKPSFWGADRIVYLPYEIEPVVEERFNRPLVYALKAMDSLYTYRFAVLAALIVAALYNPRKKKEEKIPESSAGMADNSDEISSATTASEVTGSNKSEEDAGTKKEQEKVSESPAKVPGANGDTSSATTASEVTGSNKSEDDAGT
jgi:hypothetical protein